MIMSWIHIYIEAEIKAITEFLVVCSRTKIYQNFDEMFSFPNTPKQNQQEFEFKVEYGSVSPGSSFDDANADDYLADHLFLNGKLQPHAFPIRTSSVSSKDSLLSSRSNSTSSRSSSCCASARTSSSDVSERNRFYQNYQAARKNNIVDKHPAWDHVYGSSKRWQFIAPMPDLSHDVQRRKKGAIASVRVEPKRKKEDAAKRKENSWFCWRILQSFFLACRQCHAMEPSSVRDDALRRKIKMQI